MTQQPIQFPDGQQFIMQPIQTKPKPSMSWGFPILIGVAAIPLLMLGFGFARQQAPTPQPSALSPTPSALPQQAISPQPAPSSETAAPYQAQPQAQPQPQPEPAAAVPIARIDSPNGAPNLRAAPGLNSQLLDSLQHGDLVERLSDRPVQQDGVVWLKVRFRSNVGWVANNFVEQSHVQPTR
jgi:ABC-type uncharacterized transport system involved in gliding motility auxiliary subunit